MHAGAVGSVLRHEQPGGGVGQQADPADEGEHREQNAEDHGIDVQMTAEPPAHARDDLRAPVSAQWATTGVASRRLFAHVIQDSRSRVVGTIGQRPDRTLESAG
jgi:hypothetical protein